MAKSFLPQILLVSTSITMVYFFQPASETFIKREITKRESKVSFPERKTSNIHHSTEVYFMDGNGKEVRVDSSDYFFKSNLRYICLIKKDGKWIPKTSYNIVSSSLCLNQ